MGENSNDLKNEVLKYLLSHRILTMATTDKDGEPDATALEYVNSDFIVFVSVRPGSKKIQNLIENQRVFYEIHEDTPIDLESIKKVKAIQCSAIGSIIRPEDASYQDSFQLFIIKFPAFSMIPKNKRIILKFEPKRIWFLNYEKKMFHRDEITF